MLIDPGPRTDFEVQRHPEGFGTMPTNLKEAMELLRSSTFLKEQLGASLIKGFMYVKQREWSAYMSHLTQWERDFYLNC